MKKLFTSLVLFGFCLFSSFTEESVLFDYSAKQDVLETGYDWVSNVKAVSLSGHYTLGKNLNHPITSEKYGLCVYVHSVPNADSRYAIEFCNARFNTENIGAGIIKNVADIKSMEMVLTLNRGYDEVEVVWEHNGREYRRRFNSKNASTVMNSMVEFIVKIDFDTYISDTRIKDIKQTSIVDPSNKDIVLKRVEVITHQSPPNWVYSPISIVGIKNIKVIYDKAFSDEVYIKQQEVQNTFGISPLNNLKKKLKQDIEVELKQRSYLESLKAKDPTE